MATDLGVRDSINWQVMEQKWEIQAKKEAASEFNQDFLKQVAKEDKLDGNKLFNPFFERSGNLNT
jgi:predicted dithiol-disulfide oxidoreductase (DUF899 family)